MTQYMLPNRLTILILIALDCLCTGCAQETFAPPPTTHIVKGRLLTSAGQPVKGGALQIVTADATPKSPMGEVGDDGSFELRTLNDRGQKFPGAQAGTYTATYIPVMTEAQTEQPIDLPQPVTIEARENTLELRLP